MNQDQLAFVFDEPNRLAKLNAQERKLVADAVRCIEAKYLTTGDALRSPDIAQQYLRLQLRGLPYEVFAVLLLDSHKRIVRYQELFKGTIDGASVHPREVLRLVMETNAAAVIFAHNHPTGVAEPSQPDLRITQRLKDALALVDVRVLDHFIVGDGGCVSFAERGLL